jgi:hypothetical protein
VGDIEFSQFQSVAEFYTENQTNQEILRSNVLENIRIYHKVII